MTGALKSSVAVSIAAAVVCTLSVARGARAQVTSAAEVPMLSTAAMAIALPTTEPATPDAGVPDNHRDDSNRHGGFRNQGWFGGMGAGGSGGGGGNNSPVDMPDGAEWQKISTFMIDHSPRRWAFYNNLPDNPRQHSMMHAFTRAFRNFEKAQQDEPKLADVMIQTAEAQDAVFGLVMDIHSARKGNDSDKTQSLTGDLVAKVGALVDVSFKERQLRVEQLQKTLDDLKTHLASDEKNRDGVIADRVRVLNGQRPGGPPGVPGDGGNADTTASPAPQPTTVDLTAPH